MKTELTSAQIEAGWRATFSTDNPFCPCNLKTFTKAVEWAERHIAADRAQRQAEPTDLKKLESALLTLIDECPAISLGADSWLTQRVKETFEALGTQRQAGQEPVTLVCVGGRFDSAKREHVNLYGCRHSVGTTLPMMLYAAPQPAQVPEAMAEPQKMTREAWNKAYAAQIVLRAGWTASDAEAIADEAGDFFNNDYAPDEAADEEMSNWTD